MTEQEWLACEDPQKMLDFVEGKISDRKFRLTVCAYCRSVWRFLWKRTQEAILLAERVSDETASEIDRPTVVRAPSEAACRFEEAGGDLLLEASCRYQVADTSEAGKVSARGHQVELIRDIVGDFFRPIAINPACQTEAVTMLAQSAYSKRQHPSGHLDRDILAVLADALEDAGCTNADMLAHCRGPGPHVRGCWVVDLLLGKK